MNTTTPDTSSPVDVEAFIDKWSRSGAAERANYQLLLTELCRLIGVAGPEPTQDDDRENTYVFERSVRIMNPDGSDNQGWIDLYKQGCFVLEAKQGSDKLETKKDGKSYTAEKKRKRKTGTAVRGTGRWDRAMVAARTQAEQYARALPTDEGWPPFLVVVDVGYVIELFSDFTRSGKIYTQFPDPRNYRITLDDLRREEIRERLRLLWTDPLALDPARRSAAVTRDIAEKLALLAKKFEEDGHDPQATATFLMRTIFTMFAEDVRLIPEGSFTTLLESLRDTPEKFAPMIEELWQKMDEGGFSAVVREQIPRFNGGLFTERTALPVDAEQLDLLIRAGKADWRDVEPAIFGTLLERALDPIERHKLGAHYTPRAYVERLVMPTVIEPLREEWEIVQAAATMLNESGKTKDAIDELQKFHRRLCGIRVLDPACGSGNFLYVTLEHLKRIEGEVLELLAEINQEAFVFESEGYTVDPSQLLGIEINPRAAAIADLVLWIGYLQWHLRTHGDTKPREPVLEKLENIECRDALLDYDAVEPLLDDDGTPVTRWDGRTTKKHPVTGEQVPDEEARTPVYRYLNPRKAEWPEAEYIVGNPPFIGNKRMRDALGDGYVETLRSVWKEVSSSVDYVMYWWHIAAELVRAEKSERFGFITTNSITQTFNRKVLEKQVAEGLRLAFAIPDHPWVDATDGAAVRIAMTVADVGDSSATLMKVVTEESEEQQTFVLIDGTIHPNLTVGADLTSVEQLQANGNLSFMGVTLVGQGFVVEPGDPLIDQDPAALKPYIVGNELVKLPKNRLAIDFFGLSEAEAASRHPSAYQRVLDEVKPSRMQSKRQTYRDNWWLFGEKRPTMREALDELPRFFAICRTAKHFVFQELDPGVIVESKVVAIALSDHEHLGILSSIVHILWATAVGSRHGKGNDLTYNNSRCFETFPFPTPSPEVRTRIATLAERLDAHRKRQQSEHPKLTITDMYNVLEKLRSGEELTAKEKKVHEQGLVSVLKEIHDDLDRAVLEAYGWDDLISLLGTDDFEPQILERLVALNAERAAEEERGLIRWLRPEYQNPEGSSTDGTQSSIDLKSDKKSKSKKSSAPKKRPFPDSLPEQLAAVRDILNEIGGSADPEEVASYFKGRKKVEKVRELVESLEVFGWG